MESPCAPYLTGLMGDGSTLDTSAPYCNAAKPAAGAATAPAIAAFFTLPTPGSNHGFSFKFLFSVQRLRRVFCFVFFFFFFLTWLSDWNETVRRWQARERQSDKSGEKQQHQTKSHKEEEEEKKKKKKKKKKKNRTTTAARE
jgi:hypothetical protein